MFLQQTSGGSLNWKMQIIRHAAFRSNYNVFVRSNYNLVVRDTFRHLLTFLLFGGKS